MYHADCTAIDGVRVFDRSLGYTEEREARFVARVRAALALLREHDPVRYRRAVRRLLYIVGNECPTTGQYDPDTRACEIDWNRVETRMAEAADEAADPDEEAVEIARIIVHETTHTYFIDRNIPYTEETQLRVERVCLDEEYAFMINLPAGEWEEYDPEGEMTDDEIAQAMATYPELVKEHHKRIRERFAEAFRSWFKR